MSIAIMSRLFKLPLGSCNRKLLALRLADFADDEGRGIWPTVARLATETELSERTVQRTLKEFVDEGLLVVIASASGRPGQATRYDFDLAALERIGAENRMPQPTGDSVSPLATGDTAAETGDRSDGDGCQGDTRTIIEPPREPSLERESASEAFEKVEVGQAEQAESREAIERSFKRWYAKWPTFLNDSEPAARKAWNGLSVADRAACIQRTPDFIAAVEATKTKKFTFASVYLSGKAWEKLPEKPPEAAKPEIAAPMGKAWMATRFATFHSPQKAMPKPVAMVQADLNAGGTRAEDAHIARHERYGWPKIHDMNEKLRNREPWRASAEMVALGGDFISVDIAGPVGQAWKRLHRRMLLPWLPFEPKYAYFPPIDPGADDLDKAVAAAFWGLKERIEGHAYAAAE